jgi:hypothetical protein
MYKTNDRRRFRLGVLLLAMAGSALAADILSWSFAAGLQGWAPANWEQIAETPEGLRGVTRYDAQLLSPRLDIRAEDYPVLMVLLRCDRSGAGETFFAAPGQAMADDRQDIHVLTAGPGLRLYRFDLRQAKGPWAGPIERLRFDPLNLAGADVTISLIALLPDADAMLLNGDVEILRDGLPFQWTPGGKPGRATVLGEGAASGAQALRLEAKGAWQTAEIDLPYLGAFRASGKVRGRASALRVLFAGVAGPLRETLSFELAGGAAWTPFAVEFEVPDRAFGMALRFEQPGSGQTDVDAVRVEQVRRGDIVQPPPPKPTWRAAWIWPAELLAKDQVRAWFRHGFDLPAGEVREALLQITADDGYVAALNGKELGSTVGDMDGWRTPEIIDVRAVVQPGRNALAVEARDEGSAQGLIAELTVAFADGREVRILSGKDWQSATAPQGPWSAACEVGRPPCQPWGDLVYQPTGNLGSVSLALEGVPKTTRVGGRLLVRVKAEARGMLPQSVAVKVRLERDGKVLQESWAPRLLFAGGEAAGSCGEIADVGLDIPVSVSAGQAEVRAELLGATLREPLSARTVELRCDRDTYEFPPASVRVTDGVPRIVVAGEEIDPTQNLFINPDAIQQRHGVESDVAIWTLGLEEMGYYETGYDYSKVDRTLAQYLAAKPDAWVMLTFTLDTRYHPWWLKQHPEALCAMEGGETVIGDYGGGRRQLPSYGSSVWREAYSEIVRNLIRHLRQTPYAERIIGFHPCDGISWEWFHWGSQSGELVDYSPAGQDDFRRWLRDTYGTVEALRLAWGRPEASFAAAEVPAPARRRGPALGLFFDPLTQRDVLDYNAYQHDIVADSILHFARVIKEETAGRSLVGTYYGYVTHLTESPGFCQGSGHFRLQRLLDAPEIDFLMAPVAYGWREVGGTAATMTAPGSFALHQKLFWNQADLRTHWSEQVGHGKPDSTRGSLACMRRELARNLAEGSAIQWYDFSLGWTFGDRRLTDEVKRLYEAGQARTKTPDWPAEDYLLVVVDERQMGSFDPFRPPYGLKLIYAQREQLARSGVPHRVVLWSDLQRYPELLRHRAMLLLNLFRLDEAEVAFLQEKVLRDNRLVAMVGPVGLVGERGLDVSRTARVLGRPMELRKDSRPLQAVLAADLDGVWKEAAGMRLGVSEGYPPYAVPAAAGQAKILGTFETGGGPAVLYDELVGWRLFWSAAPGLPPEVLRGLADLAGIPVVCRSNDAVYAGYGFIGIHATQAGSKSVTLPRPGRVSDLLSGRSWPKGTRAVALPMEAGDTVILRTTGR